MNKTLTNIFNKTIIGLGLTGILSCNDIKEGEIIGKKYEPERTYTYLMPIPHIQRIGKSSITRFTYMPILRLDDEDYIITIQNYTKGGKPITKTFYVDSMRYDTLKVGQYFCMDGNCLTEKEDTEVKDATPEKAKQ